MIYIEKVETTLYRTRMDRAEVDMIDCSGCGMPTKFWEHMARALCNA